jgi:hypothetical protein
VLAAALAHCQQTVDRCDSSIKGLVDFHCDSCTACVEKCVGKVDQFLVGSLSYVYNVLSRFGVTFPTDRELQEAATSGGRPLAAIPQNDGLATPASPPTLAQPAMAQPAASPAVSQVPASLPATLAQERAFETPGSATSGQWLTTSQPTEPIPVYNPQCQQWDYCQGGVWWTWWHYLWDWWNYWWLYFWAYWRQWWREGFGPWWWWWYWWLYNHGWPAKTGINHPSEQFALIVSEIRPLPGRFIQLPQPQTFGPETVEKRPLKAGRLQTIGLEPVSTTPAGLPAIAGSPFGLLPANLRDDQAGIPLAYGPEPPTTVQRMEISAEQPGEYLVIIPALPEDRTTG